MSEQLPNFKYHPDPIDTGSIEPSESKCLACSQARGFIYKAAIYAKEDLEDAICPWCIADGRAHEAFSAIFSDPMGIGGYDRWGHVPESVIQEVTQRTPGFTSWQQGFWFTHHGDAAAFLGPAGYKELEVRWPGAIESIRKFCSFIDDNAWSGFFESLHRENGPTAYVFRCLHCDELGGYVDFP